MDDQIRQSCLGHTDQQAGATPQKAMDDLARRTIRALVMNTQDMPEGKASAGMVCPYALALPCMTRLYSFYSATEMRCSSCGGVLKA